VSTTRTQPAPAENESGPDLTLEGLLHDLNNVWQTISETADLVAMDPRHASAAAVIQRTVERGRRLVGSFFEGAAASVELDAVLESAMEFARDLLQARGATIHFSRRTNPGIRLKGGPAAWERVFLNLFINAGEAMLTCGGTAPGAVRRDLVEITARRTESGVEITVTDYGPGIPAEVLPHIFQPHFSTRSPRPGLGLHIVQSLVKKNGGTITAGNRTEATGAAFRILLPAGGVQTVE